VGFTTVIDKQGFSADKKRCGNAPKKLAILKQFQTHFKAKHKKLWERRSHVLPPHYTPVDRQARNQGGKAPSKFFSPSLHFEI